MKKIRITIPSLYKLFLFLCALILISLFIKSQYTEYIYAMETFPKLWFGVNTYKDIQEGDMPPLSTGHKYFLVYDDKSRDLHLEKYTKVISNPSFTYTLSRTPLFVTSTILKGDEFENAKAHFEKIIKENNITPKYLKVYDEILAKLQGKSKDNVLVIENTSNTLEKNTTYHITLKYTKPNIFSYFLGQPTNSNDFQVGSDTTDQRVYEKQKIINHVEELLMMTSSSIGSDLALRNCPFRFGFAKNSTEFYKLIDGSKCDPKIENQIEQPTVEIYTQNLEEGKQKFREMSLAPIGLSEGPRLRVTYIHKPGGYVPPKP